MTTRTLSLSEVLLEPVFERRSFNSVLLNLLGIVGLQCLRRGRHDPGPTFVYLVYKGLLTPFNVLHVHAWLYTIGDCFSFTALNFMLYNGPD